MMFMLARTTLNVWGADARASACVLGAAVISLLPRLILDHRRGRVRAAQREVALTGGGQCSVVCGERVESGKCFLFVPRADHIRIGDLAVRERNPVGIVLLPPAIGRDRSRNLRAIRIKLKRLVFVSIRQHHRIGDVSIGERYPVAVARLPPTVHCNHSVGPDERYVEKLWLRVLGVGRGTREEIAVGRLLTSFRNVHPVLVILLPPTINDHR